MKITVDLPESDLREICLLTGIGKKGPAIRKLVTDSLMLRKRAEISAKFVSDEWSAELGAVDTSRQADRRSAQTLAEAWND